MQEFSFENNVVGGEFGYALSSLEAVLSYIMETQETLTVISSQNEKFWIAMRNGDMEKVYENSMINQEDLDASIMNAMNANATWSEEEDGSKKRESKQNEKNQSDLDNENIELSEDTLGCDKDIRKIDDNQAIFFLRSFSSSIPCLSPGTSNSLITRDHNGNNALLMAIRLNNIQLVTLLLEKLGVGIEDVNDDDETPVRLHSLSLVLGSFTSFFFIKLILKITVFCQCNS